MPNDEVAVKTMNKASGEWSHRLKAFCLVVASVVCLVGMTTLVVRFIPPYNHLHDFVQEWTSARNYFVEKPIYMDLRESVALHLGHGRERNLPVGTFNMHPPTSVLLSLPFARLDYQQAYLVWNFVSLAALAGSFWLIMRQPELAYSAWSLLPIMTLLIISNPFRQQMHHGQLNLLLLLLITGVWTAERTGRYGLSGALVGTATAIKLFPGFLFLYFVIRRQWRSLFVGAATFATLSAITGIVFGLSCFQVYIAEVLPKASHFRDWWLNASLTGFLSKLFDAPSGHVVPLWQNPGLAKLLTGISSCAVVAATAWKTWRAKSRADHNHAFGLWVIAMLLVSPITWDHYFLLLILPLTVMWKNLPASLFNRFFLIGVMIVLGINSRWIWNATIPGNGELVVGEGASPSVALPIHTLTVISYQFYALLALFAFILFTKPRNSCLEKEFISPKR